MSVGFRTAVSGNARVTAGGHPAIVDGFDSCASVTGEVTNVSLTNSGSDYTSQPSVTIAGPTHGSNTALASPTMTVASITIVQGGSNYTTNTSVAIDPPPDSGDTAATGSVSLGTGGAITGIQVTGGGTRYTSAPKVTISDVSGTSASATATLAILSILVNDQGSGYTTPSPPAVTFAGGGGAGGAASAQVQGVVTGVNLTSAGSNFSAAPSVTLSGAAGSPTTSATFVAGVAADGGSMFFPNVTLTGAWRRIKNS